MGRFPNRLCLMLAVVLCGLLCLTGCDSSPQLLLGGYGGAEYRQLVQTVLPELGTPDSGIDNQNPFSRLRDGSAAELYDVQALPALDAGAAAYWYPQILSTAVIAVDLDKTDWIPNGWRELLHSDVPVGWNPINDSEEKLLLAAMSYGLEGKSFTSEAALNLLRALQETGCLLERKPDAAISICMDVHAAALIRSGRNLRIVVPGDGTIRYVLGLVSNRQIPVPSEEDLLDAGFCLPDGRCENPAYPDRETYDSASRSADGLPVLEVTASARRDIRRQVLRTRLYSSADGREHILAPILGIVAVLLWMGTALRRSIRPEIRNTVRGIVLLILLWMVVRLIKYQSAPNSEAGMYLWFSYYVFQLGLPVLLLYLAAIIDHPETNGRPPRWIDPFVAACPALILLVFTNPLHHLLFRFQTDVAYDGPYSYGPGYYVVYAFCILTFAAALVLLVRKSWNSPQRFRWLIPSGVAVLLVLYTAGYAKNLDWARNSDYAMCFCLLALMFVEAAFQSGILPANLHYEDLFTLTAMDIQLLDRQGTAVLRGRNASELGEPLRRRLAEAPIAVLDRENDVRLFSRRIPGGTVVWQEDLSALHKLRRELEETVSRLRAANALLQKESELIRRRRDLEARVALLDSLEQEIRDNTDELGEAIELLPHAKDHWKHLTYLTLLLCHIKRRCNLFFLARESSSLSSTELMVYLDELSEFAGFAELHALSRCTAAGPLPIRQAILCYDFWFALLAWAVQAQSVTLLGQLNGDESGLVYRVIATEEVPQNAFSSGFRQRIAEAGGTLTVRTIDEDFGVYLQFSEGGSGI